MLAKFWAILLKECKVLSLFVAAVALTDFEIPRSLHLFLIHSMFSSVGDMVYCLLKRLATYDGRIPDEIVLRERVIIAYLLECE